MPPRRLRLDARSPRDRKGRREGLRAVIRATIKVAQTEEGKEPDSKIFVGAFGLTTPNTQPSLGGFMNPFNLIAAFGEGCPPVIDLCGAIEALLGDPEDRRSGHELLIDLANSNNVGYVDKYIRTKLTDDQARIVFAHLRLHKEKIDEFVGVIPKNVTVTVARNIPLAGDWAADNSGAMRMAKRIAKEWLNDFREFQPRRVSEVIRLLEHLEKRTASEGNKEGGEGKGKAEDHRGENDKTLLDTFKGYLYGRTPMRHALETALGTFKECKEDMDKILIMISDGVSTDGDPRDIAQNLKRENVKLATVYLTEDSSVPRKVLHYKPEHNWHEGQTTLFDMASRIEGSAHPVPVLASTGWSIPSQGECALYATVCSPLALDDFCSHLLSARFKYADLVLDLLDQLKTDKFVNKEHVKVRNDPSDQEGKEICYAHAVAAVVHMALLRIVGWREGDVPEIDKIRERIIAKFPETIGGRSTVKVMEKVEEWYPPLIFKEMTDEDGARQVVLRRRPVLATFFLSQPGWDTFYGFFKNEATRGSTLTEAEMEPYWNLPPGDGHAVVMTNCTPGRLTFLNSWGRKWGDNGSFSVENASVLGVSERGLRKALFYDVFWYEEELTEEERAAYREKANKEARKRYEKYGLDKLEAECLRCKSLCSTKDLVSREVLCKSCNAPFILEHEHISNAYMADRS